MTRRTPKTPARKARTWTTLTTLTRAEQEEAIHLIRGEQFMWRVGKNHNWAPEAVPVVRIRYRVLGAAIAELKKSARPAGRGRR